MYPKSSLQPGQTGSDVKKLQDFLVSQGYLTQAQVNTGYGTYGPQTTAAVKAFQRDKGVDSSSGPGYWGPKTIAAAGGQGGRETQEQVDAKYKDAASKNPVINQLTKGGSSLDDIFEALSTGNLGGIKTASGMPFSAKDQQAALKQADEDTKLYYEALQQKEKADTEATLAQKQADYQNYLLNSSQQFEEDKIKADQTAVNNGVLFSGGRYQKEKNLERAYSQDQAYKAANIGRDISNAARDFQYKYGNKEAKGLSQYYKLGGNTFNANVAQGGVGTSGLSDVYKPSAYDFQGTRKTERSTAANQRAAGLLWNKGNKLLATGYNNQY
jgi:peptidoglycan hydrolase-like protein with peptidoglycan-binding domain